jgi:hypothetical protein
MKKSFTDDFFVKKCEYNNMNVIKYLNLLVSFLLEVALLIIAGYWGFQQGENVLMKYVFAIILPVFIAILWGIFAAPKSKKRLKNPFRIIFKLTLFSLAVFFSYQMGLLLLAIIIAIITCINLVMAFVFLQDY